MKVGIIDHTESLDGRVSLLKEYFKARNYETFVITSDFSHYKKERISIKRKDYIYIHVPTYKKNLSLKRMYSHLVFARKVNHFLKKNDFDLIWCLVPPNSILEEVVKLKKTNKALKIVADIEDLWPESLPINRKLVNIFPFFQWKNLRNNNLRECTYIVTECNAYRNFLKFKDNSKMSTLFLAQEETSNYYTEDLSVDHASLKIAYLGSINNIIDIDNIEKVLRRLAKFYHLELHIIGGGERQEDFLNMLKMVPNTSIHFYGKVFSKEKKDSILRKCNFGLNIMKSSVVVGLTMKSIDYLRNGLFLINNIPYDTSDILTKNNIGFNIQNMSDESIISVCEQSYKEEQRNKVIAIYNKLFSKETFNNNMDKIFDSSSLEHDKKLKLESQE